MRTGWLLASLLLCSAASAAFGQGSGGAGPAPGSEPPQGPARPDPIPLPGDVLPVGGTPEAEVEQSGATYSAGEVGTDTPLPEGYPRPTAPGAIEVKTYPSVRRAEYHRDESPNGMSGNIAFWPLFQHIKQREIAMTAPVEMDYPGLEPDPKSEPRSWTMSFLYRSADLGPTGEFGRVRVRDVPPVTVVALGFKGPYAMEWARIKMGELEAWLDGQTGWVRDGEPRVMHYNGPDVPATRRWGEVQIPVRRAGTDAASDDSGALQE
ncbi:MAG: heme-binding protein [Phycisphaerales bacterium]|nr:heme-binding protein [Phycisphaerales bacterium]